MYVSNRMSYESWPSARDNARGQTSASLTESCTSQVPVTLTRRRGPQAGPRRAEEGDTVKRERASATPYLPLHLSSLFSVYLTFQHGSSDGRESLATEPNNKNALAVRLCRGGGEGYHALLGCPFTPSASLSSTSLHFAHDRRVSLAGKPSCRRARRETIRD